MPKMRTEREAGLREALRVGLASQRFASQKQVHYELGLDCGTIRKWAQELGLELPHVYRRKRELIVIAQYHDLGMTDHQSAKLLKCSVKHIGVIRRLLGLPPVGKFGGTSRFGGKSSVEKECPAQHA